MLSLVRCGGGEKSDGPAAPTSREDGKVPSFDGVPIAYTTVGHGAGAVLFIHGWSCDRSYWSAQIEAFAEGQRVVVVDLAGHGDSGREREDWTVESLGRDVQAVVESLDLASVVLVGHSMGGPVALEAASRMPERVVGVIGVDTFHDVEHGDRAAWAEIVAGFREDFEGRCRAFAAGMFLEDADPELVREVTADLCDAPPGIATELLARIAEYDLPAALAAVSVPVRAINGTLVPTRIEVNRRYDPDFDALILEGVGHFPMLERPDEFNRLLARVIEELTGGTTT
jgi:pimeloyl-ACP methyl ester carboxylesterase